MKFAIPLLIAAAAPLMWLAILSFAAHLGGWAALAREFRCDEPPDGQAFPMCSGSIGLANYGGCLTLRVCDAGLHMAVFFPFRFAHPPLLIPWSEFHETTTRRYLFGSTTHTAVGRPAIARLRLPGWVAEYIEGAELTERAS